MPALTLNAAGQQPRVDAFGDPLPTGAIHRLGTLRVTPDAIPALSPDGKLIATSSDRGVQFWDAVTGKQLGAVELDTQVKALAFAPDGNTLFTGNGNASCYQIELSRLASAGD